MQKFIICPTCGQAHSQSGYKACVRCGASLSPEANKGPYATLLEHFGEYTAPGGHSVQAQWSGDDLLSADEIDAGVTEPAGPYIWRLVPYDNPPVIGPDAKSKPFSQYTIDPSGEIIQETWIGDECTRQAADFTIADLVFVSKPY